MHSIYEIFVRTKTEAGESNNVDSIASDVNTNRIVEADTEGAYTGIDEDVASGNIKAKILGCYFLFYALAILNIYDLQSKLLGHS